MNDKIKSAHEIRRAYVDFFVGKDHVEVPSAPLVPKGDPTLLFTSAGMVQFKEYYLQPDNLPYRRAVSVQKCLRAGDLESVGKTLRHHTFFEMLGNFSFGDYFKREAIQYAWEFVIDLLGLPENRLSVSVFEEDDEAYEIWKEKVGIPDDRISRLGKDDNFWGPVGRTGVCGPCSEIYYDSGYERGCKKETCAPGCDCDRYIEFWNLVFPQFFLDEKGEYRPLKKPGIDTGLGLERLATIMQGVEDNFHTDIFRPIVDQLIGVIPSGVRVGNEERMGINMVADHARALTFTVSEGIYPSNEGRGYLLRRLLRRALTRYYSLGVEEPFLYRLVDVVVDLMRVDYPELEGRRRDTAMIIRAEEENFFRTLEDGKFRLGSIIEETKELGSKKIDGKKVFLLYDTFGLPVELTRALADREGLGIDERAFESEMEEQRRRAQRGSAFAGEDQELVTMIDVSKGESSIFTGYESVGGEAVIRRYRIIDKSSRPGIHWEDPEGRALELVLDRTPAYATSGGQVADGGWVEIGGRRFALRDVFKRGGEIIHLVELKGSPDELWDVLEGGGALRVQLDNERRLSTARNHTATHLLQAALREVVGEHVKQAGSLVSEDRLRFDFNHFQAVSAGERSGVEEMVNRWIRDCIHVRTELMKYKEAVERGATALFDEKYEEQVRVVRIGDISTELCGGTHVGNTGQIGLFVVISESSVAAGIRRIEALTGRGALAHLHSIIDWGEEIGGLLRVSRDDVLTKLRSLLDEMDGMKSELRRIERGGVGGEIDRIIEAAVEVDGILVASGRIPVKSASALRDQADLFRGRVSTGAAVLSAQLKGKLQFVVTVTDDLIREKKLTADRLVRELGLVAGGGGGGKKHMAQLGTKDTGSEDRVFKAFFDIVKSMVSG